MRKMHHFLLTWTYKFINFYFFKLTEKFLEKQVTKFVFFFLVRKDNIIPSVNISREKVKIHVWNVAVIVSLNLNEQISCV